jgi:hypothetical protein
MIEAHGPLAAELDAIEMTRNRLIILAREASGEAIALGPFKSSRAASAKRREVEAKPGWTYDATITLVSGADLKYLAEGIGNE